MRSFVLAVLAATLALAPAAAAAPPQEVTFAKAAVAEGVFEGTTGGAAAGDLVSQLLAPPRVTGKVWHVRFRWTVEAGARSFVAETSGILHTGTGRVVMNGRVVSGWLRGARVHEEGRLVDPDTFAFEGFLRILPSTA